MAANSLTPEYFLDCANEARATAQKSRDKEMRAIWFKIADQWEAMWKRDEPAEQSPTDE
jgi:hypothetical protein